jgi:murein DD-endopeptidase MepM/ murein hydrolase activator NlpD
MCDPGQLSTVRLARQLAADAAAQDERMLRLARISLLVFAVAALTAGFPGTGSTAAGETAPSSWVAPVASAARWRWPVPGDHRIVRPFIAPSTKYSAGHRGIDIAASGDVYAPANGVVHFVGFVVNRDVLSIQHPGGVISSYEPVSSTLHAGETVTRGEIIGTIEPGHCAELCLHFGVRIDGQYVSPLLFLGGIERPVLLP